MARVDIENVSKVYDGGVKAVDAASFTVNDEELVVLVGPSGCGKTTLLRMVAGLEVITSGTIRIGDRVVNDVAPKDRDIAMVRALPADVGQRLHGVRPEAPDGPEG